MTTLEVPDCPGCGASWIGDPIPDSARKSYGDATHFQRRIAVYSREQDMTVAWKCPDCGRVFDRFTLLEIP